MTFDNRDDIMKRLRPIGEITRCVNIGDLIEVHLEGMDVSVAGYVWYKDRKTFEREVTPESYGRRGNPVIDYGRSSVFLCALHPAFRFPEPVGLPGAMQFIGIEVENNCLSGDLRIVGYEIIKPYKDWRLTRMIRASRDVEKNLDADVTN